MIDLLLEGRQADVDALRSMLTEQGRRDRSVVERLESAVSAAPSEAITFDAEGVATVEALGLGGRRPQPLVRSLGRPGRHQPVLTTLRRV